MILLLLSFFSGMIACLLLCSPFELYPILLISFTLSILLVVIFRKQAGFQRKSMYALLPFVLVLSYAVCSFIVFNNFQSVHLKPGPTDKESKAIILYCSGEPEDYSVAFASRVLKNQPILTKPILAMKLKLSYIRVDLQQNPDSLLVASAFKDSMLRSYPYYFYMAYSDRHPYIEEAIQAAVKDGCGDISITGYSTRKPSLSSSMLLQLKTAGITLRLTPKIYTAPSFPSAMAKNILNRAKGCDAILLDISPPGSTGLDNRDVKEIQTMSEHVRQLLVDNGFDNADILITKKADAAVHSMLEKKKKRVCITRLLEDNSSLAAQLSLLQLKKRYTGKLEITLLPCWGNNKTLVRAAIEATRNRQ